MNAYKINFLYFGDGAARAVKGSVSVMAKNMAAAREAFYATHATSKGYHAVVQVEALALSELF